MSIEKLEYHPDGTYTKRIVGEDAKTIVSDALADAMHVTADLKGYGTVAPGSHPEDLVVEEVADLMQEALASALHHFRAEQAGEDGCKVEVVWPSGTRS